MNFSIVSYVIGNVLKVEGIAMLIPLLLSVINGEDTWLDFVIAIIACLIFGFIISPKKFKAGKLFPREGFAATGLSWLILSLFGALPFYISEKIPSYVDAVFEVASGFTTTGASILTEIEHLGVGLIFWRSFTHWLGGMGVLVLVLAILPMNGGYHMELMKAESPGPSVSKLVPKVSETAKKLYTIYIVLTLLCIAVYKISGMDWLDAFCIGFGTAGTGGFSIRNSGMADYSVLSQAMITIFMIVFGINFNVYYLLAKKKFKESLDSEEVRFYLIFIAVAVAIITVVLSLTAANPDWFMNFHNGAFTVASLVSSTGFGTVDFSLWPQVLQMLLLLVMFIGACAGSTGGGFKVSRFLIALKEGLREFHLLIHPEAIKSVRLDGKPVEKSVVSSVVRYFIIYILLLMLSVFLLSFDNFDFTTNFSATLATLNNIGPGLGSVGPMGNYSAYSVFSKIILIFNMIAGRLELLPILLLFYPKTWKKHF